MTVVVSSLLRACHSVLVYVPVKTSPSLYAPVRSLGLDRRDLVLGPVNSMMLSDLTGDAVCTSVKVPHVKVFVNIHV